MFHILALICIKGAFLNKLATNSLKHFQEMHPNRNSFAYSSGPSGILIPIFWPC
jgi:hypothetical protein